MSKKGKDPNTKCYFTQEDVLASNARVVTRSVREFTDDIAKRSHFLRALYGVEVRDVTNNRVGVIDNFLASPYGALVVIENAKGIPYLADTAISTLLDLANLRY